ncbi:MAG: LCP family protein [Cyanobacteriota/Melainabacteria group bacterium]
MTDSPSQTRQYFPSISQALMAAILGIAIGLLFSYGQERPRKAQPLVAHSPGAAAPQAEAPALFDMSKVKLWPSLSGRTNILLMGVDSNGKNTKRFENTRSDTMILASIDPFNKKVGLISIPRDSRVRIPEKNHLDKINAAHALGGPELAVRTVESALSVPVDHYVVIDRVGLRDVFEAIGPVTVNVENRMRYRDRASGLDIDLQPGVQELDAHQVEEYLRFRHDQKGDIGRIARQQWFLRQAQNKLKDPSVILKIPNLIQFASNYVVTDMSVQDMTALFGFAKDIGADSIETATLPGEGATIHGGSYWVIDPEASALVLKRLAGVSPSVARIADATSEQDTDEDLVYGTDTFDSEFPFQRNRMKFPDNDSFQNSYSAAFSKRPYAVVIRYPRGQEDTAKDFQDSLLQAGYKVRSMIRCRPGDCKHEQIELNSFRADDTITESLKEKFPTFKGWAVVMNPSQRTRTDMTIQIAPETSPLLPSDSVKATYDYSIQSVRPGRGFRPGEIKSLNISRPARFNKG